MYVFSGFFKLKVTQSKPESGRENKQDLDASQESLHSFALLLPLLAEQLLVLYCKGVQNGEQ